jgi:hypothetical protein
MPRRHDSSPFSLLLRPKFAIAILLIGMIATGCGAILVQPIFSGCGGALAGVGLGALYCYATHRHGRRS